MELSLKRIALGVLVGLFIVFALTLATQAQATERLVDANTLMVEKLSPTDAFIDWQAVSCGSMAEGGCDDDDLIDANSFMTALDDNGECHAKWYEIWIAENFQMTSTVATITIFRTSDLNAILENILADGQKRGIWVFGICHNNDDVTTRH